MTKPITALAVLILVDRGLLRLSDPVIRYLPGFPPQMQILHLLTHSAGLSQQAYVEGISAPCRADAQLLVDFIGGLPLDFMPGTAAEYSPVAAYSLLTAIIEQVAGMDFPTFVEKEIFTPCHMTDTTFLPSRDQWSRLIPMQGGGTIPGCVFESYPVTNPLGGAGLISSLTDYKNFAQALLEGKLLSPESHRLMTTPRLSEAVQPGHQRWGCGVRVITGEDYGRLPVGSYGWSGTYGTHFWVDPKNEITAVYMKNSRLDGGAGAKTAVAFEQIVTDCLTPAG